MTGMDFPADRQRLSTENPSIVGRPGVQDDGVEILVQAHLQPFRPVWGQVDGIVFVTQHARQLGAQVRVVFQYQDAH